MEYLCHYVGVQEGDVFQLNGCDNGATLKKIWVWAGPSQINCIQAWLIDGRSEQFGKPSGNPSEFVFEDGERFTSLSLWGNGAGTRAGGIKFKTSRSREFFVHMTERGLKTEYPIDVGSGICLGITGRALEDIHCLAFIFIDTIKSAVLKDVMYPTLEEMKPNINIEEIKSMTYHNSTSVEQEYKIETSKKIIRKSIWSTTNKIELTISMEVKAGIPEVMEASSGFSLTLGLESTYAQEHTDERHEQVSLPVKVPPGKTVVVDISIGRVTAKVPYTGTLQITCNNGIVLEYQIEGTYKGLAYTNTKTVAKETEFQPE